MPQYKISTDVGEARGDIHDEVTHQYFFSLEVILSAMDEQGTERVGASQ